MRAGIERDADTATGELLGSVDRRIRPHHDRRISHDRAAADLTAADAGGVGAAVIAPLAGIVHVGLAGFEQLAVAAERIDAPRTIDQLFRLPDPRLVALGPFDEQSFLFEQNL